MIIQPAPARQGGPGRRALRTMGLLAPLALLVGVVALGLAGPRPEPVVTMPSQAPGPQASAALLAQASPPPATPAPSPVVPRGLRPYWPDLAIGLTVRTIPEAELQLVNADGRILAVRGWLTGLQGEAACPNASLDTRGIRGPMCARRARLVVGDPVDGDPFSQLLVRFPPGVRLPPSLERAPDPADAPVPIVIVGHADGPGAPCSNSIRGCGDVLIADRVTWASNEPFDPGVIFDAGLLVPPAEIAYRHQHDAEREIMGRTGTILLVATVRPESVARMDPSAGAALAAVHRRHPEALVWYARALETVYGSTIYPPGDYPPRETWVVMDHETGRVLATGVRAPRA